MERRIKFKGQTFIVKDKGHINCKECYFNKLRNEDGECVATPCNLETIGYPYTAGTYFVLIPAIEILLKELKK